MLVGMAVSVPRRGKAPNWLSGLVTPKQIDYLPKRLNTFAAEIERLNKYPLLRPDCWIQGRKLSDSLKKVFALRVTQLPYLLQCYAAYVKGHSTDMRRFLREKVRSPRAEVVRGLIILARKETGGPRCKDLSVILSAAATEAQLPESDHTFDEPAIRALDRRMRKKQERKPSS